MFNRRVLWILVTGLSQLNQAAFAQTLSPLTEAPITQTPVTSPPTPAPVAPSLAPVTSAPAVAPVTSSQTITPTVAATPSSSAPYSPAETEFPTNVPTLIPATGNPTPTPPTPGMKSPLSSPSPSVSDKTTRKPTENYATPTSYSLSPTTSPPTTSHPTTPIVIGIAVGGAAGLLLLLGGGYYFFRNKNDGAKQVYSDGVYDNAPVSTVNGRMNDENDDISTLADSTTDKLSGSSGIGGYGDQSVATIDYGYSKAYGMGGGDSVVSASGGTFGSGTHGGQTTLGDLNPTGATASAAGFLDDGSFGNAAFRDPNAATTKEVFLDIYAPPGKLGVVIDTPDDGAPVVHAIKDSSVIANKLQVGDKLVAVDDEDVRTMTAINVSKLISRKGANATRKLSVIRTTVVRN